jgi:hypothetical protein
MHARHHNIFFIPMSKKADEMMLKTTADLRPISGFQTTALSSCSVQVLQ